MAGRTRRLLLGMAAVAMATASMVVVATPSPAQAQNLPVPLLDQLLPQLLPQLAPQLPQIPPIQGNPTPITDLLASTFRLGTGGTTRVCGTSGLGFPVYCVENVRFMPSASAGAAGTTFGHWVYCRTTCTGSLLTHELFHVEQFEEHGDLFGPAYLLEAAINGTGCENKWEKPAYQTGGQCLDP